MTDQQRPGTGPGDEQDVPVAGDRASEPTRPLRRPVAPLDPPDEPTVVTSRADVNPAGVRPAGPTDDAADEPTVVTSRADLIPPATAAGPAAVAGSDGPGEETTEVTTRGAAPSGEGPTVVTTHGAVSSGDETTVVTARGAGLSDDEPTVVTTRGGGPFGDETTVVTARADLAQGNDGADFTDSPTLAGGPDAPELGGETRRLYPAPDAPAPPSRPATLADAPEPAVSQPAVSQPTAAQPAAAEPVAARFATADPATADPATADPATAEPATADPATAEPAAADPATAQPTTGEPAAGEPGGAAAAPERDPANAGADRPAAAAEPAPSPDAVIRGAGSTQQPPWRRLSSAGALIWVLLALFGFTLVVQLRSNDTGEGLASARQDDLVRILSDLEARDTRLQAEIAALESSRQQLTSGVAGREAALAEADKRADELGLLAGTLPGRGPGLVITIDRVKASEILNAVQELRGAGGEVMQIAGGGGAVRIVASTYFVDGEGGAIVADGTRLTGPYTVTVIGVPQTMQTALEIPGGVVASVQSDGGSVTMEQRTSVEVTAVREATSLQYARPVS